MYIELKGIDFFLKKWYFYTIDLYANDSITNDMNKNLYSVA